MKSFWHSAVITPITIKSSSSKKNLNANERFSRRREVRQSLRHADHTALAEVFVAVPLAGGRRFVDDIRRGRRRHSRTLPVSYCGRSLYRSGRPACDLKTRGIDWRHMDGAGVFG